MTKREANENLATALSEWRDAGGPVEAVVMAIRQLEESTEDDPPEIKPGELVYAWDGTARPEHPETAYYMVKRKTGHHVRYGHRTIGDALDDPDGDEVLRDYEHVERFFLPFDWERWPNAKWVVDFDNTTRLIYEDAVCPRSLGESFPSGFHVVRILKRPEGK